MSTRHWDAEFIKLLPQLKRYAHAIIYSKSQKLQLSVDDYINEAYIVLSRTKKDIPKELVKNYALQAVKWTIFNKLRTESRKRHVLYESLVALNPDATINGADLLGHQTTPDYDSKLQLEQIQALTYNYPNKKAPELFNLWLQGYPRNEAGVMLDMTGKQGQDLGRKLHSFIQRRTTKPKQVKKFVATISGKIQPVIIASLTKPKPLKKKKYKRPESSKLIFSLTVIKTDFVRWKGKKYAILKNTGHSLQQIGDIYNVKREIVNYNLNVWKKTQNQVRKSPIVKCHYQSLENT
tara:strand:+ start:15467 stop:16345 length:879 start_codon:yes stop_codon:yes gene_type:complete